VRAVLALLAGIFASAALFVGPAAPAPERAELCIATLVYRGVTYYGLNAAHLGLRVGAAQGFALEPQCKAMPRRCRPGEACSPPKPRFRQVSVRRVAGVRPRIALARRDVPSVVYVAADRCRGITRPTALLRCLRRR
jgi:hypothetical protein